MRIQVSHLFRLDELFYSLPMTLHFYFHPHTILLFFFSNSYLDRNYQASKIPYYHLALDIEGYWNTTRLNVLMGTKGVFTSSLHGYDLQLYVGSDYEICLIATLLQCFIFNVCGPS